MHETVYMSGWVIHEGFYACTDCGLKLHIKEHQILPKCPRCDNYEFTKERG